MPRTLDRPGQAALVARARSGLAAGPDATMLRNITAQGVCVLVIDLIYLIGTESTNSLAAKAPSSLIVCHSKPPRLDIYTGLPAARSAAA